MNIDSLLESYVVDEEGNVYSIVSSRNLIHSINTGGYPFVRLNKDGKSYSFLVHRLVAYSHGLLEDIYNENVEVHHKDYNKFNTCLSNLEVLTQQEHAKIHNPSLRYCSECNKKLAELNTTGVCIFCQRKIIKDELSLSEIVDKVLSSNWTAASKYFGLSDNGLRKRYKSLSGKEPKNIKIDHSH